MIKKLRFLPVIMLCLVMAFIAASPAKKTEASNRIADGVHLGTIDLSGMTLDEAADAMAEYCELIADSDLTINVRNIPTEVLDKMEAGEEADPEEYEILYSVEVPVSTFDFDYDIENALRTASSIGQKGRLVERYKTLMDMKYGDAQLPLSFSIDEKKVKAYVEDVFAPENSQEAVDAKFSISINGLTVTQKEQPGIKVSNALTVNSILEAFEGDISDGMVCDAMVGTVPPNVISDDIEDVPFSRVATCTTKFWTYDNESNLNRSENIKRAAEIVNGTMVLPGHRCSMNQTIGERTEARGFKVGHAYKDGKVIDDVGGGICQFVTTLYQCVLQTEMQVNVRHNHSMRVDYVDYSQDATVNWPNVDMVFTNTWKYPVYITCSVSFGYPSSVTVSFYSYDERPSNRTVEYRTVVDATDKTVYPQLVVDKSKAAGNPTSSGVVLDAVSSHIEKIVRVGGVEQSRTRMNNDYYRPLRKIITVGGSGLGLEVSRVNDIDQIRDSNGNYLLLDSNYKPIYNGRGGYYLAKDYKHGANNVATYSGGSLVPVGGGSTTHTHSFTNWKSNGDGTHTATCSCGDKKTEDCTFNSKGKCTVCGYTKPTEPSTTEEPKPTTPAVCSHSWDKGKVTKEATCTAKGEKTYTCTKCGEHKKEDIAALGHNPIAHDAHTATCEEAGNNAYWSCDRCKKYFSDASCKTEIQQDSWVITALGHSFGEWEITKAPTHTEEGEKTRTCSRCGKTEKEPIPALEHEWSGWVSNGDGTHSHSCSCGLSETQNCTFDESGKCTVCGYTKPPEPVAPVDPGSLVLAEKLRRHFLFY